MRAVVGARGAVGLLALAACGPRAETGLPRTGTAVTELLADAGPDQAGEVGTPLTFDGSGSVGDRFAWDFGDGSTAEGPVVEHAFAAVGNYAVVLQVFDRSGGFRTDTALAVVHEPVIAQAWSASTLAVDGAGRLWAADREGGAVARVEAGGSTSFPVCADPRTVAAQGSAVAVACGGGELVELDADTGAERWRQDLGTGSAPWGVVPAAGGWTVGLQGSGALVQVSASGVVPGAALADVRGLVAGVGLYGARFRSIDGQGLLGGDATVVLPFDPGPDSDTTIRGVPNALEHLALSPDGSWLYVSGTLGNTARGLYVDGELPRFETSVRAFVDAVDPATGAQRWRKQFDDHGMAGAMALSELGNWLFVAFPTTRDVLVLDAYDGDIVSSILDAGLGIRGLRVVGSTLYLHAWLDREVRAYDLTDLANPVLSWTTSTGPEALDPQVLRGKRIFWDATDTRMAKAGYLVCAVCHPDGEHDGLTWDFTDRGEGLRNTTSLLGRAGTAMGPLHWTANFDEIQDFEHDIRGPFGGTGFLSEADWSAGTVSQTLGDPKAGLSEELDALAAYVASLDSTPVSPFPPDPAGELLFTTAGCASCHPPPLFTDSPTGDRHDVGTLGPGSGQRLGGPLDGLDTPTLLGAWQTPPWLHDGSAATLEEAIAAHDAAAGLDAAEIASLAAYVRSL